MRHSDIKLTMGVYTDPRLLDVRGSVEKLPALPLPSGSNTKADAAQATGTDDRSTTGAGAVAPAVAPTRCNREQFGSSGGAEGSTNESQNDGREDHGNAGNVNEKPPMTTQVIGGRRVGLTGFEPATSWSRNTKSQQPENSNSPVIPSIFAHFGRFAS